MFKYIRKKYEKSLQEARCALFKIRKYSQIDNFIKNLTWAINRNHKNSSWINIATLITNILGFAAYCVISPVLAEYQREKGIRTFSLIAIMVVIIIWELICLAGYKRLKHIIRFFYHVSHKVLEFSRKYFYIIVILFEFMFQVSVILIVWIVKRAGQIFYGLKHIINTIANNHKWGLKWGIFPLIAGLFFCIYFWSDVTYCTSIVEVYGIPTKVGEQLTYKERKNCASYWKIKRLSES